MNPDIPCPSRNLYPSLSPADGPDLRECVCGFRPPSDPNPDCERCSLIVERDRLREAVESALAHVNYLRATWGDEAITRRVADALRAALEPAEGGDS